MTWKDSKSIITRNLNRYGLGKAVIAGRVCQEAERLYPGLFRALSVRNGILHLEITKECELAVRLIQGKLLDDLASFCHSHNLPLPTRIRLTIRHQSDTL